MRRTMAMVVLVLGLVSAAVSCGEHRIRVNPPRRAHYAAIPEPDRFGLHESDPLTLSNDPSTFDRVNLIGPVQSASVTLSAVVSHESGLFIGALHSPNGNAAVQLREEDAPGQRWGRLMIPAERRIIAAFAANPSLGQWLIIVDDVRVHGGVDPIPRTGYRWARSDVEAYARCGIPPRAIDPCTATFYLKPHMWIEIPAGGKHGA
jgi:hypothetical protein